MCKGICNGTGHAKAFSLLLKRYAIFHGSLREVGSSLIRLMVQTHRRPLNALATPLAQIQQAAGYVRQNMKEVSWLLLSLIFAGGLIVGLLFGYWPLRSSQNVQEQLNRIEQYQAALPPRGSKRMRASAE